MATVRATRALLNMVTIFRASCSLSVFSDILNGTLQRVANMLYGVDSASIFEVPKFIIHK